ncbi:flavin reductase family protein [Gammaproteobacteria bacterium]|nr:flavin reductase family protein [Gammaproteobacteria bacterium]
MNDQDKFIKALRNLAYPVCIISNLEDDKKNAITVSSMTSLSIEPASLLACINKSASIHKALKRNNFLYVNLLSSSQEEISTICSSSDLGVSRFENNHWSYDKNDIPYLHGSQSIIGCRIEEMVEYATHSILILSIENVILNSDIPDPLLYCNGGYLKL